MGEVYQAMDTKLGREVAIKVLPEEFAKDADRIARFQREAKLLASLNHPNIAAIHGLEEADGTHFLVLELVEGQTLAERIKGAPIPPEDALKIGLQIAEALEAAHEKGVIHRDLKPANIKITPEGKVKVLDFGLAKAYSGDPSGINLSNSPTLSDAATQQGVILGTAAYMSPEQARGKPVDKRTDIWAFGCVLYEMLTGHAAFGGEDVTEILAAVVKTDVNMDLLPADIHPGVCGLLARCVMKNQRDRYRDIGDVRFETRQILADPRGVVVHPVAAETRTKSRHVALWALATAMLIIIAGFAAWNLKKVEPRRVIRYDYELPEDQQFPMTPAPLLGVSPDGNQIVYGTGNGLYLRSIDELTAKLIPGSDGLAENPFFSPDGKSIAYFSVNDSKLKKISVEGGAPTILCDVKQYNGGSWYDEVFIVYSDGSSGIMKISSKGGTPEILITQNIGLYDPQIISDGKSVLYGTSLNQIMAQSIDSDKPKELFAGSFLRYLPSGHIVYWDVERNLCAVRFDARKLEVVGERVLMVPAVDKAAVSDAGTLVYISRDAQGAIPQYSLVWVDRTGKEEPLEVPPDEYDAPRISPDGTQIALTIGPLGDNDIWILDLRRRNNRAKLTREETNEIQPLWSPDGRQIIYFSDQEDFGIYRRQADGAGEVEKLISQAGNQIFPYSITRDGKFLLIDELAAWTNSDIGMLSLEDGREKTLLLHAEYNESGAMISPDGEWIAYTSEESGDREVFIRSFPEVDERRLPVSNGGGVCPLWSPDGRELFYLSADNHVMAVSVKTEPSLSLGTPEALFPNKNLGLNFGRGYPWDIHPKDNRFLMIKPPAGADGVAATGPRKITVVLNWNVELKDRMPED